MGDTINLPNGPVAAKKLADGSYVLKTQNVDDTGAATGSGGGGGGSPLSDTIWTDDTNAYFVRRDNGASITWTDVSGTASSAPGTGARPASGLTAVIDRASYAANTGGTGFSTGDLIDHIVISDPGSGVVIGNFWINSTTSAKITAPSAGALSSIAQPLPAGAATSAAQATELTAIQAITAKLTADPATQTTLAAVLAKLTSDPATQTTLAAVLAKLSADPATQTTLAAVLTALGATLKVAPPAGIGQQSTAASISVATSKDQDPIFDHANGAKTSITASATILTPPAGCLYARVSSDVDIYVNTAGSAAVDDGTSIRIVANVPEVIPVVAGTLVKALSSSGTATVRCTPLKTR